MRRVPATAVLAILFTAPMLSAQTTDACRAQLQHLTLPPTARIDVPNETPGETPVKFLFSDSAGTEFYSVIPSNPQGGIHWFINNGVRIIVVYQDEQVRQQLIHMLKQPGVVGIPGCCRKHGILDKLKFAVYHLSASTWRIESVQYFEPPSCEPPEQVLYNNTYHTLPGLPADDRGFNWITDLNRKPFESEDDPTYLRLVEAVKGEVKEIASEYKPPKPALDTTMGSSQPGPLDPFAANLMETHAPCVEATQHLQVPEGIHPTLPGKTFSFMFSQDGIDAYLISLPRQLVLLVFQDDKTRREYLRSFIGSGSVNWIANSHQDQKAIVSFKYATFRFGVRFKGVVFLDEATFYAPGECYSRKTSIGALTGDELGYFAGQSRMLYDGNGVLYKAAIELQKLADPTPNGKQQTH
jgi:hypothetical protein